MNPFCDKKEINVVFLGGSITEGAGASEKKNCYAERVGMWFKETYGKDACVNYYNKGVGGTPSSYGLLRLSRDVISYNPDVVFVEFAVNDAGEDTRFYIESIVRSLQESCNPYIVFLYTTNETYTTNTKYYEEVANHYGIPQISLLEALKRELNGKNARECGYLKDAVHPTDKGYDVYYREIVSCITTGDYLKKPVKKEKLVSESCAVCAEFISSAGDRVIRRGSWETNSENPERPWAKTTTIGDSLELEFEGTILAIEHGLHIESTMYEIWLDGKMVETMHPVYAKIDTNQLVQWYVNFNLAPGKHNLKIKTIPCTKPEYTGTQVLIYNFIVGTRI